MSDEKSEMVENPATYTFDWKAWTDRGMTLYYVRLGGRRPPPYKRQVHVNAILDVAEDGTLAGIEIIDDAPLPPQTPPLLSQEEAFQRAVKAGLFAGLVSKPEDVA